MAIMDKESVRKSFEELRSKYNNLSKKGKVSSELRVIIDGLILLMGVVIAIFLEKKTQKNDKNSSKPSSQTKKDETSTSKKGAKGKGKNENDLSANNTRTVETCVVIPVDFCSKCGESLKNTPCECIERRTKIDIIFEKTVEHYDSEVKDCPSCNTRNKGSFPPGICGPLQYGSGIKSYVICLLIAQMVSLNRVQKMVNAMIARKISEAIILKYVLQLHAALEPWEKSAKEFFIRQSYIHTDETSFRVNKKNQWIHVYASEDVTLKVLHPKRGKAAIESINIIPRYGGTIIHDCWASYLTYDNCSHGLCGSHILRELTFVIESNGYAWSKNIKKLLQEACMNVSKSKRKKLAQTEYARLQSRYRNILTRGEKELPEVARKPDGRRGRIAKSDAHNLLERLVNYEEAVLLFAKESHVAFTNNRAERDLRMSKVKQKVSGCFRVEKYAQAYCRISSYLQTMASKGVNPLVAIQKALEGKEELEG